MSKKLPVYKMQISKDEKSDLEVSYVALVTDPAIERDFMAFAEQRSMKFEADEERHIVTGPLMLADVPIYRRNGDEEYLVVFDKETVEAIALKFMKKGYQQNVNLMHDEDQQVSGVTMFESWIVDKQRGVKALKGYEDAKPGSWFGSFKVENEEVWAKIKEGEFKGFSVEGIFELIPTGEEASFLKTLFAITPESDEENELLQAVKKLIA
jgi:hypothetical protein